MSDAVSMLERSWFQMIQDHIASLPIEDKTCKKPINWCLPNSEESEYYRKVWQSYFPEEASNMIPHFWLPNQDWFETEIKDPSARTLKCYHNES